MNTHTIRKFITEPDSSGNNITALSYCALGIVSTLAMSLTGIIRIAGGHYASASAYFVLSLLSLLIFLYSFRCLQRGETSKLSKISYPLTVGGFIFGLTALFFIDGGIFGGVPVFFVFAVAATPCFMPMSEAVPIVCLEILTYFSNAVFSFCYPDSINKALAVPGNSLLPIIIVSVLLCAFLHTLHVFIPSSAVEIRQRDSRSKFSERSEKLIPQQHEPRNSYTDELDFGNERDDFT